MSEIHPHRHPDSHHNGNNNHHQHHAGPRLTQGGTGDLDDHRKRLAEPPSQPDLPIFKKPKRVPAPGAITEVLARMEAAERHHHFSYAEDDDDDEDFEDYDDDDYYEPRGGNRHPPAAGASKRKPAPPSTAAAAAATGHVVAGVGGQAKRKPAPGATQAALAHLSSRQNHAGPTNGHYHHQSTGGASAARAKPRAPSASGRGPAKYPNSTVVWAKLPSFPWWPGQIQQPTADNNRLKHTAADQFVVFYGTNRCSYILHYHLVSPRLFLFI